MAGKIRYYNPTTKKWEIGDAGAVVSEDGKTRYDAVGVKKIETDVAGAKSSIEQLKKDVIDTKKSVSDGKTLVAKSITSKGVPTSATDTFGTMATNIDKIETDKTGDATMVASNLLQGKTGYAKGVKVTGTMKDNGAVNQTITTKKGSVTIPQGYHSGQGKIVADYGGLVSGDKISGTDGISINLESRLLWEKTIPDMGSVYVITKRNEIYITKRDSKIIDVYNSSGVKTRTIDTSKFDTSNSYHIDKSLGNFKVSNSSMEVFTDPRVFYDHTGKLLSRIEEASNLQSPYNNNVGVYQRRFGYGNKSYEFVKLNPKTGGDEVVSNIEENSTYYREKLDGVIIYSDFRVAFYDGYSVKRIDGNYVNKFTGGYYYRPSTNIGQSGSNYLMVINEDDGYGTKVLKLDSSFGGGSIVDVNNKRLSEYSYMDYIITDGVTGYLTHRNGEQLSIKSNPDLKSLSILGVLNKENVIAYNSSAKRLVCYTYDFIVTIK